MLEKTMRLNYLFDFYQALLTPKQQEYMKMYYIEDFSLVEIAKLSKVSRQAVYDNIKRTEGILESYEAKLFLYEKFEQRNTLLLNLKKTISSQQGDHKDPIIDMLHKLIELS